MKYSNFRFAILPVVLLAVSLSGCGENVRLQGKVTFSDDNSPLTGGAVYFETDDYVARGELKPDGSYQVGSLSSRDGILPGTYRVYITGATRDVGVDKDGMPISESLIDGKYASGTTSGLEIDVTNETRRFDIVVDRPATAKKP